jgi:hypothetical protein
MATIRLPSIPFVWLLFAAYRAIRRGRCKPSPPMVMRNFARTFGAVTLRIHLGLLTGVFGYDFAAPYPTVAWISWVPNLLLVEWWLVQRGADR